MIQLLIKIVVKVLTEVTGLREDDTAVYYMYLSRKTFKQGNYIYYKQIILPCQDENMLGLTENELKWTHFRSIVENRLDFY